MSRVGFQAVSFPRMHEKENAGARRTQRTANRDRQKAAAEVWYPIAMMVGDGRDGKIRCLFVVVRQTEPYSGGSTGRRGSRLLAESLSVMLC